MSGPNVMPAWKAPKRKTTSKVRKRRADEKLRLKVRRIVLARARFQCEYKALVPEVECGWLPDRNLLEVDELRGGSFRSTEWLDPDRCRATCPAHHDHKTANKREVLRRLGEPGL